MCIRHRRLFLGLLAGCADINARTHADMDMAFHFQNDKRFTNRRARYAEAFGKIPFRRQALAFG